MRTRTLAAAAAVSLFCTSALAEDELIGRTIGSACFGCHGAGTASGAAIPPIILGAPAAFIETSLKAFRDGERPSTIMQRIAKGYTDEEIAAVAKYLSAQGGN